MGAYLKVMTETTKLYLISQNNYKTVSTGVSKNNSGTLFYGTITVSSGFSENYVNQNDGFPTFHFADNDILLDKIAQFDGVPSVKVCKGVTFGKKVPNEWSVMAKILETGCPLVNVPKSGVRFEWTRDDLIDYANKLIKALNDNRKNPGITINKLEFVSQSVSQNANSSPNGS
jgi:hypothetical protein